MSENNTTEQPKEGRAGIVVLTCIALLLIMFSEIPILQAYLVGVLILSFISANIGKDRQIGFNNAFFVTFFLGGVIGLIIVILSKKIDDKPTAIIEKQNVADELLKFYELKERGVITEEEFEKQKSKLI